MKWTLLFSCLSTLCTVTLFAQTGESTRDVHVAEKSASRVSPQEAPKGLKKIYSSLDESEKIDLYNYTNALPVFGPNSVAGVAWFTAMAFTPKSDAHVSLVQVAVQYSGAGANQMNLSIYSDSTGAPGTLLAGPVTVTNLPAAQTCCGLAVASFTPVAVTGGTQYWVVADTPLTGTGSDFLGVWACAFKPVMLLAGTSAGNPWASLNGDGRPAGEVLGTIP